MEDIRHERPNEVLILKVNKQEIWQFLHKKFGTHMENSVVFKFFKNKQRIIPRNKAF